jgi:DNA replication protein DnaC
VSSTAKLLDSIPQGTGTCEACAEEVAPYDYRGCTFTPKLCPSCIEAEQLNADRKAQRHANRHLHEQQQLRRAFEDYRFDTYSPNGNRRAYERCRLYAETFRAGAGDGLALQGGVGVGKTHLAVSVARLVPGAYVINAVELLQEIRDSFGPDGKPTKTYQRCLVAPLLVLDDMGKAKPSEWALERFYQLINYRIENMLPIVVTTNDPPDSWDMRWGEAVADRIRGACSLVEFVGLSHRALRR